MSKQSNNSHPLVYYLVDYDDVFNIIFSLTMSGTYEHNKILQLAEKYEIKDLSKFIRDKAHEFLTQTPGGDQVDGIIPASLRVNYHLDRSNQHVQIKRNHLLQKMQIKLNNLLQNMQIKHNHLLQNMDVGKKIGSPGAHLINFRLFIDDLSTLKFDLTIREHFKKIKIMTKIFETTIADIVNAINNKTPLNRVVARALRAESMEKSRTDRSKFFMLILLAQWLHQLYPRRNFILPFFDDSLREDAKKGKLDVLIGAETLCKNSDLLPKNVEVIYNCMDMYHFLHPSELSDKSKFEDFLDKYAVDGTIDNKACNPFTYMVERKCSVQGTGQTMSQGELEEVAAAAIPSKRSGGRQIHEILSQWLEQFRNPQFVKQLFVTQLIDNLIEAALQRSEDKKVSCPTTSMQRLNLNHNP